MRLLRLIALGAAGVVAYRMWKRRQADAADTSYPSEHDLGEFTPPHGDPLLGAATASWEPEPAVAASQSSRGFGGS
ncbi:hypothetical protein [Pseudoxanthomonas sp. JBR18]|uniref:hypothetical protein n=1 Tax=Pseudoxanthomonas sp. JBR18 TaxID=2969308 RepID=UPI002304EEA5|nr:hypothetical protein [Pseudoxanthomonas sp. JBR18]WCE02549.1 hypothetical protein PJ250_10295 [Pseudoxanthomonas sp. JBR18]